MSDNYSSSKDELWNYPAAIALLHSESHIPENEINILGTPIPIATGPYQGAYKSYLLALNMGLLGYSSFSLKITALVLSIALLFSLAWAIPMPSIATFIFIAFIPCIDFHYLIGTALDYGPTLIQCLGITIALGACIRFLQRGKSAWLCLCAAAFGLAINDKITCAPNLLAITLAILLCGKSLLFKNGNWKDSLIFAPLSFLLVGFPFLLYLLRVGITPMLEMTSGGQKTSGLLSFVQEFGRMYNSDFFIFAMTAENLKAGNNIYPHISLIVLVIALAYLCYRSIYKKDIIATFLILSTALSFILQAQVGGLRRPWHFFELYPFIIVLTGYALSLLAQENEKRIFNVFAYAMLFALISVGVHSNYERVINLHASTGVNLNSPAMYELSREVSKMDSSKTVALNYSISEPLYVYSGGLVNIRDFTWLQADDKLRELRENLSIEYVIRRVPAKTKGLPESQFEFLGGDAEVPYFSEIKRIQDQKGSKYIILERTE